MSLFRWVYQPPKHTDWKTWISEALSSPQEVSQFAKTVWLIQHFSGLPFLQKDVWNLIIAQVFRVDVIDPERWKRNPLTWFEEWRRNPMLQIHDPILRVVRWGPHSQDRVELLVHATLWVPCEDTNTFYTVVGSASRVFCGIEIEDLSNVASISLTFRGIDYGLFILESLFFHSSLPSGGNHPDQSNKDLNFFYHPRAPLWPEYGCLTLVVKDSNQIVPKVSPVYGFFPNGIRNGFEFFF